VNVRNIHMGLAMHHLAAHLDDIGRPAWIGLTVLSFFVWWPLGLVVLGYLFGSGRMTCWSEGAGPRWQRRMERMQRRMGRMHEAAERWGRGGRGGDYGRSTGNRAFDEYRAETLRRLEEEQQEFRDFLDRLRHAKDKAEFDEFMTERRRRGYSAGSQSQEI
jgi:hypothetical protein